MKKIKKKEIVNEINMKDDDEVIADKEEDEKEENKEVEIKNEENKKIYKKLLEKGINKFKTNNGNIIISKSILDALDIKEIKGLKDKTQLNNLKSLRKYGITDDITQKYIDNNAKFLSTGANKKLKEKMYAETVRAHEELKIN